jgi:malate synthase
VERVSRILSHTYAAGPFRSLSPREAATAVAELLNTSPSQVEGEITAGAPRFDRSEAAVTMEMLLKQLTSPRYIQHSARLLFVLAGLEDSERSMVMEAVFSPSRDWVVDQVRRAVLPSKALRIHDYVYDYWGV